MKILDKMFSLPYTKMHKEFQYYFLKNKINKGCSSSTGKGGGGGKKAAGPAALFLQTEKRSVSKH